MNYLYLSDDKLLELSGVGDTAAEEQLIKKYSRLVRRCARPLFLSGGDSEDLLQEGLMGLLSAVRAYNPELKTPFGAYAEICIKHRLFSAVKSASSLKHTPLNLGVPLDDLLSEDRNSMYCSDMTQQSPTPEEQVLARESKSEILSKASRFLSQFESNVLDLYLDGLSYIEMAQQMGKAEKSIDNAVQRIRKKLSRQTLFRR